MIVSEPSQAEVVINGKIVGKTPYKLRRTVTNNTRIYLRLTLPTYETKDTILTKDGDINKLNHYLGYLLIFPFDFDRNFKKKYNIMLQPKKQPVITSSDLKTVVEAEEDDVSKSTKLKILLDEYKSGKISREEFEALKKEILKKD